MPLSKANIETAIRLAAVVLQRYEQVNQLSQVLLTGAVYRNPDGSIAIPITPEQIAQADDLIRKLLDDADAATAAIRAMTAPAGPAVGADGRPPA